MNLSPSDINIFLNIAQLPHIARVELFIFCYCPVCCDAIILAAAARGQSLAKSADTGSGGQTSRPYLLI